MKYLKNKDALNRRKYMNKTQKLGKSSKEKIISVLKKNNNLTGAQLRSRVGVKNIRARISELRQHGFQIESYSTLNSKGKEVYHYHLYA